MQKILIVDDEESIRSSLKLLFSKKGFEVFTAERGEEAKTLLFSLEDPLQPDLILLDVRLPDSDGIDLLSSFREHLPESKIIIITAYGDVPQSVEAMKKGALDYVVKPFSVDELLLRVDRALKEKKREEKALYLERKEEGRRSQKFIQGPNLAMQKIFSDLKKIATTPSTTVFITGETGTGKELIAQYVHEMSSRSKEPFVEVNAAALSSELLESELFGHEAGAFTGAMKAKKGLFEVAHGGTLFLDEIGDMPKDMQAKILRVLQDKRVRRVGGTRFTKVDVRLITATNRDLEKAVADGHFREDLFFRLNVVPVALPPLRERMDDLEVLTYHFLEVFSREFGKEVRELSQEALQAMQNYRWPGNIRELRNLIERALLLECKGPVLEAFHLNLSLKESSTALSRPVLGREVALETIEREHIEGVLRATGGNKNRASQVLGIDRTTLYNKIKKFNLS